MKHMKSLLLLPIFGLCGASYAMDRAEQFNSQRLDCCQNHAANCLKVTAALRYQVYEDNSCGFTLGDSKLILFHRVGALDIRPLLDRGDDTGYYLVVRDDLVVQRVLSPGYPNACKIKVIGSYNSYSGTFFKPLGSDLEKAKIYYSFDISDFQK